MMISKFVFLKVPVLVLVVTTGHDVANVANGLLMLGRSNSPLLSNNSPLLSTDDTASPTLLKKEHFDPKSEEENMHPKSEEENMRNKVSMQNWVLAQLGLPTTGLPITSSALCDSDFWIGECLEEDIYADIVVKRFGFPENLTDFFGKFDLSNEEVVEQRENALKSLIVAMISQWEMEEMDYDLSKEKTLLSVSSLFDRLKKCVRARKSDLLSQIKEINPRTAWRDFHRDVKLMRRALSSMKQNFHTVAEMWKLEFELLGFFDEGSLVEQDFQSFLSNGQDFKSLRKTLKMLRTNSNYKVGIRDMTKIIQYYREQALDDHSSETHVGYLEKLNAYVREGVHDRSALWQDIHDNKGVPAWRRRALITKIKDEKEEKEAMITKIINGKQGTVTYWHSSKNEEVEQVQRYTEEDRHLLKGYTKEALAGILQTQESKSTIE